MTAPPSDSPAPSHTTALTVLVIMILVWGGNWPVMKIGLRDIAPLQFAFLRFASGAACLFAVLVFTSKFRLPERRDLPVLASVGLIQMGLFLSLVNVALQYVDAGRSAILAYTMPLWVVPLALLFLGEKLNARKTIGLATGFAGIAVLFNPLGFDWTEPATVIGNGLLMLAAFSWACVIVQLRGHRWNLSPLQLAPWQLSLAAIATGLLALIFESGEAISWTPSLWAVLAYNGPLATAFAFWAAVYVSRALPAISSSVGFLGVPVVGYLASALALGEAITLTTGGGLVLIVAGIGAVMLSERRRA